MEALEAFFLLMTLVGLSLLAFSVAYANFKFGVEIYTLLSARDDPLSSIKGAVSWTLRLCDIILKASFFYSVLALMLPQQYPIVLLLAVLLTFYFSRRSNYQLALEVLSRPPSPLSKNLRENLTHLLRWLRVGVDVSSRAVGFLSLLTSLVALFVN